MNATNQRLCAAFIGDNLVAEGDLLNVAIQLKAMFSDASANPFLVFDQDGSQIDIDLRGSEDEVSARLSTRFSLPVQADPGEASAESAQRGVGRPKLGVVAREVTLLPRHWDWLNNQPGGASVALRKLVEEAKKTHADRDTIRQSQEAAYRFMSAKAGNYEGFEEACRALFRSDRATFCQYTSSWPEGVQYFARKLAEAALASVE
jgi:hypothetical protein